MSGRSSFWVYPRGQVRGLVNTVRSFSIEARPPDNRAWSWPEERGAGISSPGKGVAIGAAPKPQ